jgi:hypothetical protein
MAKKNAAIAPAAAKTVTGTNHFQFRVIHPGLGGCGSGGGVAVLMDSPDESHSGRRLQEVPPWAVFPAMTDWEERYVTGDMPWEKGAPAPPLLEILAKIPRDSWGAGPVLVPGCGLGHDVRALASLEIPILGLDLSPTAIQRAEKFPQAGLESYELGNFLDPAWAGGRKFTAIWEHTCFCAIDPAERARYAACLPAGGLLAGVFYLNPYDPGEEEDGPPFGVTVEELEKWFAPSFERLDAWVPRSAYPGREGKEWVALFRRVG